MRMNRLQPAPEVSALSIPTSRSIEMPLWLRRSAAAIGLVAILSACSANGNQDSEQRSSAASAGASGAETANPTAGEVIQSAGETSDGELLCAGSPSQAEIDALADDEVIVDGACDPEPSKPVGIYEGTAQYPDQVVDAVFTGTILRGACVDANGDEAVASLSEAASSEWVEVTAVVSEREESQEGEETYPQDISGKIPAVWVHGDKKLAKC